MAKSEDIIGRRFGFLVALERDLTKTRSYFICKCDCGIVKSVRKTHLLRAAIKSCGSSEHSAKRIHGKCATKEYWCWRAAKERCFNPNNPGFKNYGGRGITMCDRWRNSFIHFYEDMGPSHGLTLDRKDNSGNYDPDNCQWVTQETQMHNIRKNVYITHDGLTLTLREWARRSGIPYTTLRARYVRGYDPFQPHKKS